MDVMPVFYELIEIEDLDVWEGLSHVGGNREVYLDALRLFCSDFSSKAISVRDAASSGDWTNYTIHIHAIKGALASIGAWMLAASALDLETASKSGNFAFCTEKTAAALDSIGNFVGQLRSTALFPASGAEKTEGDPAFLEEKLNALEKACRSGFGDEAEELAGELRSRHFSDEADSIIEAIGEAVAGLDYDIALEKIPALRSSL